MGAGIEIMGIALGMSIISLALQRKFVDKKGMKETQKRIKEKQKKLNELTKKHKGKVTKEIEQLNQEIIAETSKMFKGTTKHMIISMAIALPLFWVLSSHYKNTVIHLPLSIPIFGNTMGWLWWYIIWVMVLTTVIDKIITKISDIYDSTSK